MSRFPLSIPRLPPRANTYASSRVPWLCASCLLRRRNAPQTRRLPFPSRATKQSDFHTSSSRRADASSANHYDVLQLAPTASAAEIKRQFYSLSKTHHPDRNPNDPTATTRFVAISEAYHTLSVPEKRTKYDVQLAQSQGSKKWAGEWRAAGEQSHPQGSYSSASFAGSRPASGLNKKRSTFRGPPPSFYKSGGYGKHGTKRAEYANYQQHRTEPRKDAGPESYGGFEGFGPGQTRHGDEVPHFNHRRHKETLEQIDKHIQTRRKAWTPPEMADEYRGGQLAHFLLVAGALGIIVCGGSVLGGMYNVKKAKT
ncbi:unnamed protein product [Periconia digitata]|uniref:J domain-containing protein n=1 Tax=Periconia digitata TaxID=1303443 RepID=A0A9W4XP60_9PLEO|nr:unnamed protein product [Periconia digitata]